MSKQLRVCRWFAAGILTMAAWSAAEGAITYVDATDGATGNTAIAPSAGGGVWTTNTADAADGIWRLRTTFGLASTATSVPSGGAIDTSAGTVYESTGNSSPSDAVPRLVTTVNGLASATYNVYAYFWSDQNSSPWRIRAGLTDGTDPLPLFVGGSAPSGSPVPVDTTVRDGAGRILWQASLGTETGTQLKVYIDDAPATTNNERTWYDGVGYQAVPEPGTLVLLVLGVPAFMLAARRRNRAA